MRCHMWLMGLVTAGPLLFTSASCAPKYGYDDRWYSSADDALAAQKQASDASLAQIAPTESPVGGSVVLITPSDELLLERWVAPHSKAKPTDDQVDYLVRSNRNQMLFLVEAMRRNHAFDQVQWRRSADPEREHFKEDFAVILTADKLEWSLRARTQTAQNAVSVETGPASLSALQQTTIWLRSIEQNARKLKEP